jgi:hypothetical protein
VDESSPSETEKETAHRVRAGGVGALATLNLVLPPPIGKSGMMVKILDWHFIREPLGISGLKEGAAGAVGE